MTDAVWIKLLDTVPNTLTAIGVTITAIGSLYASRQAWLAKKVGQVSATHAEVAAATTRQVREGQVEIKQQTDGQLSAALADRDHWREVATLLMAMKSAEEGRPITAVSQIIRANDPILKRSGNGGVAHERRASDKPDESKDPE